MQQAQVLLCFVFIINRMRAVRQLLSNFIAVLMVHSMFGGFSLLSCNIKVLYFAQVVSDAENAALQQQLLGTSRDVKQMERTMRDIATLNQMFSTQVVQQSEQIEHMYDQVWRLYCLTAVAKQAAF